MVALSNTSARQFKIPGWFTLPLLIGILVVGFWLIATFLAPYMTPYDPLQMADRRLQIPSWSHWLGTDALGRDVLARTLYGARHSLPIALVVVVSAVIIGALAGAVAGYRGGWVDAAIAAGAGSGRILFKHILPLCWTPVLISATMDLGQVILLAA
ncbi:ABC transporter permease, partial [Brucella melitensis]